MSRGVSGGEKEKKEKASGKKRGGIVNAKTTMVHREKNSGSDRRPKTCF